MLIVGAGKGGLALLDMFAGDPTVTIVGVADVNGWAPGIDRARRIGVPVATDFRDFLCGAPIDLIIDVTGDPDVRRAIHDLKPADAEVMGGLGARFMWDLLAEKRKAEELEDRYSLVVRELSAQAEGELIVGQNPEMRAVADTIARVAPTAATVLIRGESGTGKELVARTIHRHSPLRGKPLLTVNCTALTPALMDVELFGYRRTPASHSANDRVGLLERGDGGTVFLDEIGDVPLPLQAKLVRVLDTGEVRSVGDGVVRRVRVRVIAATNRDLERAVARKEFLGELFSRLRSSTITLPPLRDRAEDLPVLAYHFLRKAEAKVNKKVERLSPEALDVLRRYAWPGNLRELENIIERAVVLASDRTIEPLHLPLHLQTPGGALVLRSEGLLEARERVARDFERQAILTLLAETRGNISVAARLARTTRRNFHRLLLKHHIDADAFRGGLSEASSA